MDIIPDKLRIVGLVEQSAEGKICPPIFQGDFVRSRVEWRVECADPVGSIACTSSGRFSLCGATL